MYRTTLNVDIKNWYDSLAQKQKTPQMEEARSAIQAGMDLLDRMSATAKELSNKKIPPDQILYDGLVVYALSKNIERTKITSQYDVITGGVERFIKSLAYFNVPGFKPTGSASWYAGVLTIATTYEPSPELLGDE